MDILSIRKKKGAKAAEASAAQKATAPSPAQSDPTATAATTAAAMTPPAEAAPKPQATAAMPPQTTVAAPRRATTPPTAASAMTTMGPPKRSPSTATEPAAHDPLAGFLARYDSVSDADDDFIGVRAVSTETGDRYLSFWLAGESYAASIMDIREILTIRSLTDVPRAPKEILGVISKRGVVLPVIDLATMLGLRAADRRLRSTQRLLVVGEGDRTCGLRVDRVAEVFKLAAHQIEGVPASVGVKNAGMLLGLGRIDQALYILLDLPSLLDTFAASLGLPPARASKDAHLE